MGNKRNLEPKSPFETAKGTHKYNVDPCEVKGIENPKVIFKKLWKHYTYRICTSTFICILYCNIL